LLLKLEPKHKSAPAVQPFHDFLHVSNKTNNLNPETLAIAPPIEEHTDFSGEMKVCGQG
jgi:hypothetical protein